MTGERLPFEAYPKGGRTLLGKPKTGDGTARRGYGVDVLAWCCYRCAYCGLDMSVFEGWLQLAVDHVIPQQMQGVARYPADWVLDQINTVVACAACNGFLNRDVVLDVTPRSIEEFCRLRDRVFLDRRDKILRRRVAERAWFDERVVPPDSLRALAGWATAFADRRFHVGDWKGGDHLPDGSIQMPWYEPSPETARFVQEMYAANLVCGVDWMEWAGTERGHALMEDPAAIASATAIELVYLVTTIIRGERFGDGQIEGAIERGSLLAAAQRAGALLGASREAGR